MHKLAFSTEAAALPSLAAATRSHLGHKRLIQMKKEPGPRFAYAGARGSGAGPRAARSDFSTQLSTGWRADIKPK
jgi:hypothetical protein